MSGNNDDVCNSSDSPDSGGEETESEEQVEEGLEEESVHKENKSSSNKEAEESSEEKKKSDALIDELYSVLLESSAPVDVADIITEDKRSRRERDSRRRSRSHSPSRKHKHKKSKKEKKHRKRDDTRSRSGKKRSKRDRSSSSDISAKGKTGTLGDIKIITKDLQELHKNAPISAVSMEDEEDELPVGADYRTVLHEAIASSSTAAPNHPSSSLPLPVEGKAASFRPAFPLSKSDELKKDPIAVEKKSELLTKVISERSGTSLVPRKLQLDTKKAANGVEREVKEEEEELSLGAPPPVQQPTTKIAFGNISLKITPVPMPPEKEPQNEAGSVKKEESGEKLTKKLAVTRKRSASPSEVDNTKRKREEKKSKEKNSKSDDKRSDGKSTRSGDRGDRKEKGRRDSKRDGGRSRRSRSRTPEKKRRRTPERVERVERNNSRRRSRSRSADKIDKKKLLEIALQNSRGGNAPTQKEKMNMKVLEKAGGKNIGDIVSYCQKLSEAEKNERGDDRSDSDDDRAAYRRREIRMNIKDSKQLPTRTPQERLLDNAPLRAAFPVSSGAVHREVAGENSFAEWKKVDPSVPSVCSNEQKKLVAMNSMARVKAVEEGKAVSTPVFPILPPPPAPPKLKGDLIPAPPKPPSFNFVPASVVPPPPLPPVIVTPSIDRLIDAPDSHYDEVR